jgi:hypothetical protein
MLARYNIGVIGGEDLGTMIRNNVGVHSDEVRKQRIDRRRRGRKWRRREEAKGMRRDQRSCWR